MANDEVTFNDYHKAASATAGAFSSPDQRLSAWTISLAGEVGEACNIVKKQLHHGLSDIDATAEMISELGDILWYLDQLASCYGVTLNFIAQSNIAKLKERYPEGFVERGKESL